MLTNINLTEMFMFRQQREEEELAAAGGWMAWLGFSWGKEGRSQEDDVERQRQCSCWDYPYFLFFRNLPHHRFTRIGKT